MLNATWAIIFLWYIRTIKFVLFWIYLWQLKEYHVGRFLDHFRTQKGRQIFLNGFYLGKILLLGLVFADPLFLYVVLAVYTLESSMFVFQITKRGFKKPTFTFKALLLVGVLLFLALALGYASYRHQNAGWLIGFDIGLPAIAAAVVLLFQPFFVLGRSNILRRARQKLASHKNIIVVAITGSYGKTSTKEFLAAILSSKFRVLATPEHKNSEIGIAQTILNDLNPEHQIFVVEMGSYNKGGIRFLCDMVKPTIGMVTGVNGQHLATFGSWENLLSAEGGRELEDCLPKDGLLVVNGENKHCVDLYQASVKNKKLYALNNNRLDADIWTEDISATTGAVSCIVRDKQKEMAGVSVNVLGKHHIQNLLGAMLVSKELGMSLGEIANACKQIRQDQAGAILRQGKFGIALIDSSYSSNPDGVMAELDYLALWPHKKAVIMPCLIELGPQSKGIHYQIGKKIAKVCDLAIITTKDAFKDVQRGALESGMKPEAILLCDKPEDIFKKVTTVCTQGDAILLEGRVPGQLIRLLVNEKKV